MQDYSLNNDNGGAPPRLSLHPNNHVEHVDFMHSNDDDDESFSSGGHFSWRKQIRENVLLNLSPTYYSLDESKLPFLSGLISMLMLASSLACIAGVDAMVHCHSQQVYEINELFDDDAVIYTQLQRVQEEYSCQHMFRFVMIPITVITIVCGVLSKCWITRLYQSIQQEYHLFVKILCISVLVLVSWTYGIFCIMLRPKNLRNTQDVNNSYQSLAAVDQMGHVGDNANLYYLTWICFGFSLAIVYEVSIETARKQRRQMNDSLPNTSVRHANVEVTATTSAQLQFFKDSRESWYHSLYRLRIRTGIWVAALVATVVVLTSSLLMWSDVLRPAASAAVGHDMRFLGVCSAIPNTSNGDSSQLPPELCVRTAFSIISGATAAILCLTAIIIHASTRRVARQVIMELSSAFFREDSVLGGPLKVEFILSAWLCSLLGLNAVFATAVQGPAATVGNLYYASWISFLLCLRILLGCLEEMYNLHHEEDDESTASSAMPTKSASTDAASSAAIMSPDLFDNKRARRSRRYLFLGIVSTVCSASALDACFNQSSDLSWDQRYVIIAPAVVALLCAIQFSMCLGPVSYLIISSNLVGGTLAVLMFLVWFVDLIITMHSERSWAVDAIGDIKIANLYYFSWASMVTAGLNMSTFLTKFLGKHDEDYMSVIWGVLVKVSAVIFSGSFHIWHNIKGTCSVQDSIEASAIDFCSRTVFALMVSFVGIFVGGVVVFCRVCLALCCPAFPPRIRFHVEMIVSCFLVLVFAVALAVVTGIGGPGQSVGDLFYATWLAFLVSLGIAVSCYGELRYTVSQEWNGSKEQAKQGERDTNFIQMIS